MGWKKVSKKLHHDKKAEHKAFLNDARELKELLPGRDFPAPVEEPEPEVVPVSGRSRRRIRRMAKKGLS